MNIDDFFAGEFLIAAIVKHHPQITFYIILLYYSDLPNQVTLNHFVEFISNCTMWMFVLVMIVLTRTRSEDDSRVLTTQSTAEGSASTRISRPNRRHKLNSTNTRATEQPADTEQNFVDPPKRRGPNLNLSVNRTLQDLPDGSKIPLRMDEHTISFVGTSATDFATECGIIMCNFCPMNYHTWELVPEDAKNLMYEKLESLTMYSIRCRENSSYCEQIPFLWKWNHLCDYWELEKTKKYSDKMEANRAKQVNISRGGSRSIANHTFQMINPETQMPPSPLEVYHKLYFNATKQGWLNENSRIEYVSIF
ncbi:putative transposase, Ptta/En/Spm, plant [Helianthus anomalus]